MEEIQTVQDDPSQSEKKGLRTHNRIRGDLCGRVVELKPGYAKISLKTTSEMIADEKGMIHSGFLFCAADFAAMACINDPYVFPLSGNVNFLTPVKNGDIIIFEAFEKYQNEKKREIEVKATLDDIKILTANFTALIFQEHILNNKLPEYR